MPDPLKNAPVVGMKKKFPRSFGRYFLEKSLSRGGMGEVFLAQAKGVRQRCVIKTIRGDLTGDEEFVGRFADEAKIMVRIDHDNIIRVFDAGKVGADYYIAMEYVHGRDLGDVLDRAYERGEPMPTQLGLYVTSQLLKGLEYAHSLTDERGRHMGLVHRDISPQNVLIGFDGSVKLIDFGLARTDLLPARTQGALAVGKYGYMSPEQARHERIDGRADIYSTGVMLFEVFTGDRLVDEQDQSTLWQRVLNPKHRSPRTVVPSLMPQIDTLVMTAVGVRPEERYQSAQAMCDFTETLRTKESSPDAFVSYLRYLYPKVDFSAPPVPDLTNMSLDGSGSEQSIIIATSREGALSVFGRGDLPIEWTRQIDAAELRKAAAEEREKQEKRKAARKNFDPVTDSEITQHGPSTDPNNGNVEATYIRTRDDITKDVPRAGLDAPTMVARYPSADISSEETKYERPRSPSSDFGGEDTDQEGTLEAAPVLGLSSVSQYRDDEMTVMMSAPPASISRPQEPLDDDGDAPTRLSKVHVEDMPPPSVVNVQQNVPAANTKGRAIKERRKAPPQQPPSQQRKAPREQPKIQVHRQTVPTHTPPPDPASGRRDFDARQPEPTMPEAPGPQPLGLLLPGLILMGIALIVTIVVIFVTRL